MPRTSQSAFFRLMGLAVALLFLSLALFSPAFFSNTTAAQEQPNNTDMAQQTIARLNQWRIGMDLWPLKPNAMLTELALGQARYVLSLPSVPQGGDIHLGRRREQPYERARDAGWTTYNHPERVAINEIAIYGSNLDFAINWWRRSTLHSDIIQNPAYREVGAAVIRDGDMYLFIVVVGSRPAVLPALYNPLDSSLYLSNERYRWANGGNWIQDATRVALYREDGSPLTADWQAWSNRVQLPPIADSSVIVVYSDAAGHLAMSPVNLARDWVLLPGSIPLSDAAPAVAAGMTPTQPAPAAATPTIVASMPLIATNTAAAPAAQPTQLPIPTATLLPTVGAPVSGAPVSGAPVSSGAADVTLIYDRSSLTVLNTSSGTIDLTAFDMVGTQHHLDAARWALVVRDVPLASFPAGHCLQVWSWSNPNLLPAPSECRIRRAVITIDPSAFFWNSGSFEARNANATLAQCQPDAGRCTVDLP